MKQLFSRLLAFMLCCTLLFSLCSPDVQANEVSEADVSETLYTDAEASDPDGNEGNDQIPESFYAETEEAEPTENAEDSQAVDDEDSDTEADQTDQEWTQLLNLDDHSSYISGYENGFFRPNGNLTRAETAVMLYSLLKDDLHNGHQFFSDVPLYGWYSNSVNVLADLGIISGDERGYYRPDEPITRAEFVTMISHFFEIQTGESSFTDIGGHWAYEYIISAIAQGWISGYDDNTFRPNRNISRAEAVALINKMTGRFGDRTVIMTENYHLFPDVLPSDWHYCAIMEASVEHTGTVSEGAEVWTSYSAPQSILEQGYHVIDGYTFYVTSARLFAHDTTIDGLTFGSNCKYTSGNTTLDGYLRNIVLDRTDSADSRATMRSKLYTYTTYRLTYVDSSLISKGTTGWETTRAINMIQTGRGNCYSFAAVFYHLARYIGYPCNTVIGTFAGGAHCWVEVPINGVTYVCDPQLDWRYRSWGNYNYNFYMTTYSRLPSGYAK